MPGLFHSSFPVCTETQCSVEAGIGLVLLETANRCSPMTVGLELVTVTPLDFLTRPLLWAELISKYGGTVTAAPNFAYAGERARW